MRKEPRISASMKREAVVESKRDDENVDESAWRALFVLRGCSLRASTRLERVGG